MKAFASEIHSGKIRSGSGQTFGHVLLIGIGGSALGPQFVADALGSVADPMKIHFLDNTDPDNLTRLIAHADDLTKREMAQLREVCAQLTL